MLIKKVKAWKIKNSRNEETIEVMVKADSKEYASAPSGASRGKKEVTAFPKNGVGEAVGFVNNTLRNKIVGMKIEKFEDIAMVEKILRQYDKTDNWNIIGGNTVIAVELALLKAMADGCVWKFLNKDIRHIPRPLGNVVGGGMHTKEKEKIEFQEFLVISLNAFNITEAIEANRMVWKLAKSEVKAKDVNDEGAWISKLSAEEILDKLNEIIKRVSKEFTFDLRLGVDIAASHLFNGKKYIYRDKRLSKKEQINYVCNLINKYNLIYVEDPFEESDFRSFSELTKKVKGRCMVCGDDLICTNPELLRKAIKNKAINAVIIKPNQVGSILKTKEVVEIAKKNKINIVMSHRSGETRDAVLSHLAVGFDAPIIKCGVFGKERETKLYELRRIEQQIKAGKAMLQRRF
ncbi:MAG: enolase C-terminal domain-like protein [Nanoarchaeota archaeon]